MLRTRTDDRSIDYTATEDVAAAIARIGRTEDVRFSPDGSRLVLIGHFTDRLLILDLEMGGPGPHRVMLTAFTEVESPSLGRPHGAVWIDAETLIVANRAAALSMIRIPEARGATVTVDAVRIMGANGEDLIKTPGSIEINAIGDGLIEMFVCNNYVDHVSRHLIDTRNGYQLIASDVLVDDVSVPDGIALSPSGRWIAISNHESRDVLIVRDDRRQGSPARPAGALTGTRYPHGLTFTPDERHVLVADAGAPQVLLYSSDDGDWSGERKPSQVIRTMSDALFRRGHRFPSEGGPKGMDLSRDSRIMVTTCQEQPLAFFDMDGLIESCGPVETPQDAVRDILVSYLVSSRAEKLREGQAMQRVFEFDRKLLAEQQQRVNRLLASSSWRITAPLRWFGERVKGRKG